MFTKPTYDTIQTTQAQIVQYNAALAKAAQLQGLKATLLSRYNAFNAADLARLQVLLPDSVNNIGLILDLDTLAHRFGFSITNVNIDSTALASPNGAGKSGTVGSANVYDSLGVSFAINGTYAQYLQFISNLETSLRIVDLVNVTVASGGTSSVVPSLNQKPGATVSSGPTYNFTITLRTYWLK